MKQRPHRGIGGSRNKPLDDAADSVKIAVVDCLTAAPELRQGVPVIKQLNLSDERLSALKTRVDAYTRLIRDAATPSGRVLLIVKETLTDADPTIEYNSPIMISALAWCIDAYFDNK